MISRLKTLLYLIELINCYAVVYYSNFLFFFMKHEYGFGEVENLLLAAFSGTIYVLASWQGGAFAQRHGYLRALYIGSAGISVSLAVGMFLHAAFAQVMVFGLWTVSVCFIWPALEALVSEQSGRSLSNMVGLYNVTWAGGASVGYFTAGMLLEKLGMESLFWLPLSLIVMQLILLPFVARLSKKAYNNNDNEISVSPAVGPAKARQFLYMAWLANPFSYVAINTVIPLIPSIAVKLGLSTGLAGIVCSVWMFARLAAFVSLWYWRGWHYRFEWLAGAYVVMIACFVGFLVAKSIILLFFAQIGFGLSIGLIYYSSLFYSMNVSEEQGANAGRHEAMIGVGLSLGPAFGALSLYLFPLAANIGAWSVGGLLLAGFSGLMWMRRFRA